MIIDFSNINGGGGGGYVLPIASQSTLGGVKIGSGVNIDSAGTISVNSSDPSTLKSVSALPLTAASGDVVVYDNMEWYYSPTTGSSVNITKSGKIIRVKYYNLPNGAKFPFPNEDVGQTPQTGPWFTYNNGYFYFCWEEDGQTITGETYSMNSRWVIFEDTLEGVHSGSQTYGEMVFNWNGYDFSLYTEGNWPNQSAGHWEPLDWSSDFKPSLPVATNVDCGMVRIGNGINVDSAGTISVDSQGGGIEVVTSLPSSGTDGQTVMLIENRPEEIITKSPSSIGSDTLEISVTAVGITNAVTLWNYEWYGARIYVTVNPDNSVSLYNDYDQVTTNYPVSSSSYTYVQPIEPSNDLTLTVGESGFTIVSAQAIAKENILPDIHNHSEEIETLYTWSDNALLTTDIDYTENSENYWCVRFKYSKLPQGTLCIWKYKYANEYIHLVYENGALKAYGSDNDTTITGNGTVVPQYSHNEYRYGVVYWTDDEIVVWQKDYSNRVSINFNLFYMNGWHKEVEHKISNKAFYKDFTWFDGDYNVIVKNNGYNLYNVGLKINPDSQWSTPYNVYSNSNSTIGPFFAPTTTGTTGQVCIAGNGWAAPTWTNPENITNGVKFWKGTLDEYEAIGEGNYDANTLYICTDE